MGMFEEFNLMKEKIKKYEAMFAPWTEKLNKREDIIHEQGKEITELQDKLDCSTRKLAALKVDNGVMLSRVKDRTRRLAYSEAKVLLCRQEDNTMLKKKVKRLEKSLVSYKDLFHKEVNSALDARKELDKERSLTNNLNARLNDSVWRRDFDKIVKKNRHLRDQLEERRSDNDFLAAAQKAESQVNTFRDLYVKANKEIAELQDQVKGLKGAVVNYRDLYETVFHNLKELEEKHVKQTEELTAVFNKVRAIKLGTHSLMTAAVCDEILDGVKDDKQSKS